jgi:hypothetical protein
MIHSSGIIASNPHLVAYESHIKQILAGITFKFPADSVQYESSSASAAGNRKSAARSTMHKAMPSFLFS